MITADPALITTPITQTLKDTIADWCGDLEVGNEKTFKRDINRILARDYPRYCERLRIDVRDADNAPRYDWMVGSYLEREINRTGNSTKTASGSEETTNNGTTGSTTTNSGSDTRSGSTTGKRTPELTHTKEITGSESNTRSGSEATSRTMNNGARSGSQATLHKQGTKVVTSGRPESMDSEYSSNRSATKSGPMDAAVQSTGSETLPATNTFSLGTIENVVPSFGGHASAIGQTAATDKKLHQEKTDNTQETTYTGTSPDTVTTDQAAVTDTENGSTTYNGVKDLHEYTDRVDTDKDTGTETSEGTSSETQNFGHIITTEGTNGSTGSSKSTQDESASDNSQDREIMTGRSEAPADILIRAREFIEGSNAWEWLYPRLLVCFQGILEV